MKSTFTAQPSPATWRFSKTVFLIKTIPAWSGDLTNRAIGTPKLAFVDTGLLCHLLGQGPGRLADPGGAAGPVLENFVLMELARQLSWNDERATLWHYRTKDKVEVDAVLESADGRVIGIEVKAGATLHKQDFAGLRHLQDRLGDQFVAGFVLYTDNIPYPSATACAHSLSTFCGRPHHNDPATPQLPDAGNPHGVTPVLLQSCRPNVADMPSPRHRPWRPALDEPRRELGTDRVELGELDREDQPSIRQCLAGGAWQPLTAFRTTDAQALATGDIGPRTRYR